MKEERILHSLGAKGNAPFMTRHVITSLYIYFYKSPQTGQKDSLHEGLGEGSRKLRIKQNKTKQREK